jgi:ubiquinone/menaquinone biosynthesis C-methylase UbiE
MPRTSNITSPIEQLLSTTDAGRVLDIATGNGGFIHLLIGTLKSYSEIIGVDASEQGFRSGLQAFEGKQVHFQHMEAECLDFPNASFDTVSISNSLHHMKNLCKVSSEMLRVLKPGGNLLIAEMVCDNQTKTQMSHVLLHHWWAAIDTANGITHLETFTRKSIVDFCSTLSLSLMNFYEHADLASNPKQKDLMDELDSVIDRYLQKAAGTMDEKNLCDQGEELRKRIRRIGFHSATQLFMIGKK